MNIVDRIISPNIWDEQWQLGLYGTSDGTYYPTITNRICSKNFIKVEPNKTYYWNKGWAWVIYYTEAKAFISSYNLVNNTFTTPSDCYFILLDIAAAYGATYNHDICINESNPSINGKYFPYVMYKRYDMVDLILPREYQKVEYIESTGTQYIDTGYIANINTKVIADIQVTQLLEKNTAMFGSRIRPSVQAFCFGEGSNGTVFFANFDTVLANNIKIVNDDTNRHTHTLSKDGYYIDNILSKTFINPTEITEQLTSYIFYFNSVDTTTLVPVKAKLYSCKIYDNNILVRDFIPCYRKADNEIGLYDTVNNQFYTNQGTGTFLKGENVNNYKRLKIGG